VVGTGLHILDAAAIRCRRFHVSLVHHHPGWSRSSVAIAADESARGKVLLAKDGKITLQDKDGNSEVFAVAADAKITLDKSAKLEEIASGNDRQGHRENAGDRNGDSHRGEIEEYRGGSRRRAASSRSRVDARRNGPAVPTTSHSHATDTPNLHPRQLRESASIKLREIYDNFLAALAGGDLFPGMVG
jgi:hypothetical protein